MSSTQYFPISTLSSLAPYSFLNIMLSSKQTIYILATSWAVAAFKVLPSVTTLELTNQVVAPDGFARSATLAGGTFPAPLIQATIVS
jgi:hypothetical protein